MDELNNILKQQAENMLLIPSPAVWLKVEHDIERRERRRRWLIFFLWFAVLLIGGFTLLQLYANNWIRIGKGDIKTKQQQHHTPKAIPSATIITNNSTTISKPELRIKDQQKVKTPKISDVVYVTESIAGNAPQVPIVDKHIPEREAFTEKEEISNMPYLAIAPHQNRKTVLHAKQFITANHQQIALPQILPSEQEEVVPLNSAGIKPIKATHAPKAANYYHHQVVLPQILPSEQEEVVSITAAGIKPIKTTHTPKVTNHHQQIVLPQILPSEQEDVMPVTSAEIEPIKTIHSPKTIKNSGLEATIASPVLIEAASAIISKDAAIATVDQPVLAGEYNAFKDDTVTLSAPLLKKKPGRWSIAVSLNPATSYSRIEEDNEFHFVQNSRNATSKNLITADFSLKTFYKADSWLEVYTGIGMHFMGERMAVLQDIYKYGPIIPNSGGITWVANGVALNEDSSGRITNRFSYLELPLGVRVNLINNKKFSIQLDAGITINKLTGFKGYYYDTARKDYLPMKRDILQPWMIGYNVGLSVQYALQKNLRLELMPYYRRYGHSVFKDDYSNIHQYFQQAGLSFSLRYMFGQGVR